MLPIKIYKVLKPETQSSTYAPAWAKVHYRVGEKVRAPRKLAERGYHLTAFMDLDTAQKFVTGNFSIPFLEAKLEIWEAWGHQKVDLLPRLDIHSVVYDLAFSLEGLNWPSGTVMYKYIELIKKVE